MTVGERARRIGENEALWRRINELAPPVPGVMNSVFCECGVAGCEAKVSVTAMEYEDVRRASTTFIVCPGHELPEAEVVVKANDRFVVVEKQGEAAAVAQRTDPRE
ncbi:MAG TPA: hypothetical protein VJ689_01055 [Gaiellaceae bacterium]|nr:hypothetical protein [Gaiellaceae bacterium]